MRSKYDIRNAVYDKDGNRTVGGKKIYRKYVPDCEHEGDIRDTRYEIEKAGGYPINEEWNRRDCGEAYVEFVVRTKIASKEEAVLKKLWMI